MRVHLKHGQRTLSSKIISDLTLLNPFLEDLVYTMEEWNGLLEKEGLFARTLQREAVWVFPVLTS
jgi:hypothetical protein